MTIVRWEPLRELSSLQNEMNRLFNTVFDAPAPGNGGRHAPLDAGRWTWSRPTTTSCCAPICPGMGEDDVKIELEDGTLTVSGERKAEHESKSEGYYRVERAFGALLAVADAAARASTPRPSPRASTAGVLEVRIPKPEERKPRRIEIAGAGSPTIEA